MRFLATLFWMMVAVAVALFSSRNWRDVTLDLWGPIRLDIKLPLLIALAMLLGALVAWALGRGRAWKQTRGEVRPVAPPPSPPSDEPLA